MTRGRLCTRRRPIPLKTLGLILGLVGLIVTGIVLNRAGYVSSERISTLLLELGCWGVPVFFLCFVVGGLVQIPGVLFVVAARLAFGPTAGFFVGYAGAILAVTAGFAMVRIMRGRKPGGSPLKNAWAQRMLERAETRPILTIAILRLLFFLSPPLNVGLGFSSVRLHHYVVGSAIGIALPTALVTVATGLI
tara:strand:- start:70517 stop:71092 length:576 start_codon:yes stop_codon:yes gene_type:complete